MRRKRFTIRVFPRLHAETGETLCISYFHPSYPSDEYAKITSSFAVYFAHWHKKQTRTNERTKSKSKSQWILKNKERLGSITINNDIVINLFAKDDWLTLSFVKIFSLSLFFFYDRNRLTRVRLTNISYFSLHICALLFDEL